MFHSVHGDIIVTNETNKMHTLTCRISLCDLTSTVRRCETVEKFGISFVSLIISGFKYVETRRGLTVRQMWLLYQCLLLTL
jgi:hypothetical protein